MSTNKAISLHIGLNSVDPIHYAGWNGNLVACENDANDMANIAKSLNYDEINILLTKEATRQNVTDKIANIASTLESNDFFLLTYSGHGGQVPDKNGDEDDNIDETWALYDGQLIDDELANLWTKFKINVRIFVLSDSCNSGTVIKAINSNKTSNKIATYSEIRYKYIPELVANKTYLLNKEFYTNILKDMPLKENNNNILASVRLISGSQEDQPSEDCAFNGLFTGYLLRVWDEGNFSGNYLEFYNSIKNIMPSKQIPNHLFIGKINSEYDNQKPFSK
jgi:metacaspase-1